MPKINVLPKQVAELIAAGEVVERPASVIKELVENSIDAGANIITVEIQRGGITYMRITDNGCGIAYDDVSLAFLRHATSKIRIDEDLNSISTLGFRGEALAAISSVARVEMFTKTENDEIGTHYCIEGAEETVYEEAGCPNGTTIVIRDIFFNTPARMKFLKKDVSESNAVAAVLDRIALSHPEISFKFIRDGKNTLNTSGDGKINNAVYSILGREFSNSLIKLNGESNRVKVNGLTCKPLSCRPTRNNQFVFLNGRLIRSGTVTAAVEQAYKNSCMVGKFPGFVIYLTIPYDCVDVNVHPAKTEVRFSDEKMIFDAVYSTVKSTLLSGDTRPEIKIKAPEFNPFERLNKKEFKQETIKTDGEIGLHNNQNYVELKNTSIPQFVNRYSVVGKDGTPSMPNESNTIKIPLPVEDNSNKEYSSKIVKVDITREEDEEEKPPIVLIGEAFKTYIIVEYSNSIYMIDKHAAHERIIFNKLKKQQKCETQPLLTPISVSLTHEDYDTIISNTDVLKKSGFEIEDFGNSVVLVRAVPSTLTSENVQSLIQELAGSLSQGSLVESEREEKLFHSVACKAAIKAGSNTSSYEMEKLAKQVLYSDDVMYCPHGRPVAFEIKKYELEKQFGRIQ